MKCSGKSENVAPVTIYTKQLETSHMCDIWCIYRFGGLIDGCSALGVVYEMSLEVVMTTHAWCAGDAGIAIWRARFFAAHLRVGA